MLAFAANSLLCRAALKTTDIDAASFTAIRLISGAITLWLLMRNQRIVLPPSNSWHGALFLFIYAACFSFAYLQLSTATGALLLFGAVQISMLTYGFICGERFSVQQTIGIFIAISGMIILLLPGVSRPPIGAALLMIVSGIAWAVYSLLGRQAINPLAATAKNFIYTIPLVIILLIFFQHNLNYDIEGIFYAFLAGTITSGIGYSIWFKVLPKLAATSAATVQLSVPVLATIMGILLLNEALTWRISLTSLAILSGISLVITYRTKPN